MKVLLSWLSEFADFYSLDKEGGPDEISDALVKTLADAMNNLGLVVEEIDKVGGNLDAVFVAKVVEIEAIKGADKIRRVIVDVGDKGEIQVVCGAFNFVVGDYVPYAAIGAALPNGLTIKAAKMRGVDSFGMLCSKTELRLGADSSGLMILDRALILGTPIAEALSIRPDVLFDLAIEANRPDANSVIGVARDLAAHFRLPFCQPMAVSFDVGKDDSLKLAQVTDLDLCDRLLLARIGDVSKLKIKEFVPLRLELCGMRSINPIVDASNYVMLELGQPTHPYDATKLASGVVSVRAAKPTDELVTLDGVVRKLASDQRDGFLDIVIVDSKDEVVGLGGIMGGESSEISDSTESVLLEIAHFNSSTIAKTSKRLQLRSEASARFERGVDLELPPIALARFCELLDTSPSAVLEVVPLAFEPKRVKLRFERLNSYLNHEFMIDEVKGLLEPIGFGVVPMGADLSITVPSFRPDCSIEVDIIEEVARHYGYSKVDKLRLNPPQVGGLNRRQKLRREIRGFARDNGFYEMWGSSMLSPTEHSPFGISDQAVALSNPLAREESVLRRSLLPSMARALVRNSNRQITPIRLFEMGKVFEPRVTEEGLPLETERMAFLLTSPESATDEMTRILGLCYGFFKLPQPILDSPTVLHEESIMTSWPILHSTRSAAVVSDGTPIGVLGELDRDLVAALTSNTTKDRVAYLELDLGLIFAQLPGAVQAKAVSAFPPSEFDLAFLVPDSVGAQEMVNAVRSSAGEFCESAYLFDSYKSKEMGEGIKSLAVKIRLQNPNATVTDTEIQDAIARIASDMDMSFGAKLRTV